MYKKNPTLVSRIKNSTKHISQVDMGLSETVFTNHTDSLAISTSHDVLFFLNVVLCFTVVGIIMSVLKATSTSGLT